MATAEVAVGVEGGDVVDAIEEAWRREQPDMDVSSIGVVTRLWRIARHLERGHRVETGRRDLDQGTVEVLTELRRAGFPYQRTAGELQARTLVSSGGLSQRLQRMEDAGLIARTISPVDRRVVDVRLTEDGVVLIDGLTRDLMEIDSSLVSCLEEDEAARLRALLRRLLVRLES